MKTLLRPIVAAFVLFGLAGCLSQQVRTHALAPALASVLSGIQTDASAAPDVDAGVVAEFGGDVTAQNFTNALILWPRVEAWGQAGIDAQLAAGKFGVVGASERRERLKQFDLDLRKAAAQ